MISRFLSFAPLTIFVAILTSCGNSDLHVVSKTSIKPQGTPHSGATRTASSGSGGLWMKSTQNEAFQLPDPSANVINAATAKPKDRHNMPVYAFSDRSRVVRTTAYTCTEDDHLIYGNKNATGTQLRYTERVRSAAADWSFYPVGTVFRIKGMPHLYVIDDYGSALTGTGTIDIYKPSKAVMNQWGRRNVEITIVQWGSFTRSAEILSQRTKHAHCNQMLVNIVRQRPDLGRLAKR